MRVRKYVNNPKLLLEQGRQIVTGSADYKFVHRVSMVNLMLSGLSAKTLSEFCGDSERTLQSWLKKVDEFGWDSLHDAKHSGRPGKLSDQQIREIEAALRAGPEASDCDAWDGPTLSDYIKTKYDIEYSARACQLLMHKLGLY